MDVNTSTIIKELEALDSEIVVLINLTENSSEAGQISNILIESIHKRLQSISFSLFNLQLGLHTALGSPSKFDSSTSSENVIATLLGSLMTKVLLKTIVVCNNNLQVSAPIANKLQNRDNGLIADFNKLLDIIDSLVAPKI